MLNEKIKKAEEVKAKEDARIAKEKERKRTARTSTRRRSTRQNPIVKVLTSATFIRGVFNVLKKL